MLLILQALYFKWAHLQLEPAGWVLYQLSRQLSLSSSLPPTIKQFEGTHFLLASCEGLDVDLVEGAYLGLYNSDL
jgi:hypothetical protein